MTLNRYDNHYRADTARITGEVHIGDNVNIWYGAAIRGDVAPIHIGAGSNVQDNAVIHCDHLYANVIGERVVIGHSAIVHGEAVGDNSLIGMGAVVLGRTKIGKRCLIAAGAVVPPGLEVPDGMVVMGVPGKIVRETNDAEKQYLDKLPDHYVQLAQRYIDHPDDPRLFDQGAL